MERHRVGILAVVLLVIGGVLEFSGLAESGYQQWSAACVRIGILLAVMWLALPQLGLWSSKVFLFGTLFLAVVLAVRPKLFIFALVAVIVVAVLRPRMKKLREGP